MDPEQSQRDVVPPPQDPLSGVLVRFAKPISIAFLFTVVISFYEVLMRYVFDAPTVWVHETTTFVTAMCFAFGGAYCLAIDKHIRVVLLYDAVGPKTRRILDIGISIVACLSCLLMSWAAWGFASKALWTPSGQFHLETSGSAWNPPYPAIVKVFLFLMLVAMAGQWAWQARRHIRRDPMADTHHGEPGEGVFDDA